MGARFERYRSSGANVRPACLVTCDIVLDTYRFHQAVLVVAYWRPGLKVD